MDSERHWIIEYLRSDLYERVPTPGDDLGMTWMSPLRWKVRISGHRDDPTVEIWWPSGEPYGRREHCHASDLQGWLP